MLYCGELLQPIIAKGASRPKPVQYEWVKCKKCGAFYPIHDGEHDHRC